MGAKGQQVIRKAAGVGMTSVVAVALSDRCLVCVLAWICLACAVLKTLRLRVAKQNWGAGERCNNRNL